jgi:hypothetical protein
VRGINIGNSVLEWTLIIITLENIANPDNHKGYYNEQEKQVRAAAAPQEKE